MLNRWFIECITVCLRIPLPTSRNDWSAMVDERNPVNWRSASVVYINWHSRKADRLSIKCINRMSTKDDVLDKLRSQQYLPLERSHCYIRQATNTCFVHSYLYTRFGLAVCAPVCVCMHACAYVRLFVCMHVYSHACRQACVRTHASAYVRKCVRTSSGVYWCILVCIDVYWCVLVCS